VRFEKAMLNHCHTLKK